MKIKIAFLWITFLIGAVNCREVELQWLGNSALLICQNRNRSEPISSCQWVHNNQTSYPDARLRDVTSYQYLVENDTKGYCNLRISSVSIEDDGLWTCEIDWIVQKEIDIAVINVSLKLLHSVMWCCSILMIGIFALFMISFKDSWFPYMSTWKQFRFTVFYNPKAEDPLESTLNEASLTKSSENYFQGLSHSAVDECVTTVDSTIAPAMEGYLLLKGSTFHLDERLWFSIRTKPILYCGPDEEDPPEQLLWRNKREQTQENVLIKALNLCQLKANKERSFQLTLISDNKRAVTLQAESEIDFDEWFSAFQFATSNIFSSSMDMKELYEYNSSAFASFDLPNNSTSEA